MEGSLTGEPLRPYVNEQVKLRQKIHGKEKRSNDDLTYLNSRTSWIKLASGTSIEQSRLDMIPELKTSSKYLGLGLAENFILFNGLSKAGSETLKQRSSFLGPNGTYGVGGFDFGIVPMPGIENVTVRSMDMGSIKKATITLKVYNKQQFDIIDILYLRLGYTLLLEWGDSHYLDNNSPNDPVGNINTTIIESKFFETSKKSALKTNYNTLLELIEKEREKYSACYDGLIGKVSNFRWTFNGKCLIQ